MACNADFVQYVVEQCADAGEIVAKKMFGDYGIYCDGLLFGLICDNCLYVKPTDVGKTMLQEEILRAPYDGAKPYFFVRDIDDRTFLSCLVKVTCDSLLESKLKGKKIRTKKDTL